MRRREWVETCRVSLRDTTSRVTVTYITCIYVPPPPASPPPPPPPLPPPPPSPPPPPQVHHRVSFDIDLEKDTAFEEKAWPTRRRQLPDLSQLSRLSQLPQLQQLSQEPQRQQLTQLPKLSEILQLSQLAHRQSPHAIFPAENCSLI